MQNNFGPKIEETGGIRLDSIWTFRLKKIRFIPNRLNHVAVNCY